MGKDENTVWVMYLSLTLVASLEKDMMMPDKEEVRKEVWGLLQKWFNRTKGRGWVLVSCCLPNWPKTRLVFFVHNLSILVKARSMMLDGKKCEVCGL